jgi:hypothetical protein
MQHGMLNIVVSDKFRGFSVEAIECIAALRPIQPLSAIQYLRLQFGCTCGACVDGFLSPRMKFALHWEAESIYEMLKRGIEDEDGDVWYMKNEYLFAYVASNIRESFVIGDTDRKGFTSIFNHAAATLNANKSPTVVNVMSVRGESDLWPSCTRNYLQDGGTVESCLKIVFEHARGHDRLAGDHVHMDMCKKDIEALPECRNDHEFGFVALACGLSISTVDDTRIVEL